MKRFRAIVGGLCLAASLAVGVRSCAAAEAAIEGATPIGTGAAAFAAGLFLGIGFLLSGLAALIGRRSDGWAFAAAVPAAVANLFVYGGGDAAAAQAPWTWAGWAVSAALVASGVYGIRQRRRQARIGLPPGTGRS